jgi:VWFA-related protein
MRWARRVDLVVAALLCMVLAQGVAAQSPSLRIRSLDSDDFPNMVLLFDARDTNGVPVRGLTREHLSIEEDGQPRSVESLTSHFNEDIEISLALVVDVSGSVQGEPLQNAQQALDHLLDELNPRDRVAILAARAEVPVDPQQMAEGSEIDFTTDRDALRQVVAKLEVQAEETALYDALLKAAVLTAREHAPYRAIIVMTDGRDPGRSRIATADDPINEANRHQIPIFTIGMGEPRDEAYLQRVAIRTGGIDTTATVPAELDELFQDVLELLKQEYRASYTSSLADEAGGEYVLKLSSTHSGAQVSDELRVRRPAVARPPASRDQAEPSPQPRATIAATAVPSTPEPTRGVAVAVPAASVAPAPVEATPVASVVSPEEPARAIPLVGITGMLLFLILGLVVLLILQARVENGGREEGGDDEWEPDPLHPDLVPAWPAGYLATMEASTGAASEIRQGVPEARGAALPPTRTLLVPASTGEGPRAYLLQPGTSRKFMLGGDGPIEIGRSPDCAIQLEYPTVSGVHALISFHGEAFLIEDAGSRNGTFVNGERAEGQHVLREGDRVEIGEAELLFRQP